MNHHNHVTLLRPGVPPGGGTWADLGSGTGAFTLALADLLGPGGVIYSVDRDGGALGEQRRALQARFPATSVHYQTADFTGLLRLPSLDGIVMANALHFVPDDQKPGLLQRLGNYLKPGGCLILVEYNVDRGNPWVPYPLSYHTYAALAGRLGLGDTRLLATVPSRFLGEIYSALSHRLAVPQTFGRGYDDEHLR